MADIYKTLMVSEATKPHVRDYIDSGVWVETTSSDTTNGENLIAAYAKAKTLTPNGQALSATNRACVIVPPGKYNLDYGEEGACVPLTLDTQYVDIIGLTTDRALQHIYGTPAATNSGVIVQTANDVHISNLTVEILTEVVEANFDNTDSAAYFPSTDLNNTEITNCEFIGGEGGDGGNPILFSMRVAIEYSGTFANLKGGFCAIGGMGTASGTFNNCILLSQSFAIGGVISGKLINCQMLTDALSAPKASVATVAIESGGTSYEVDDELTVVGGTGTAATLKVTSVDDYNDGTITGISILTVGAYTVEPGNPVSTTGHSANATFNLTWNEGHIYGCVDSTGFIAEQNWND